MKRFDWRQLPEALSYAASGEQAIHLHRFLGSSVSAPGCFVRAVRTGGWMAHLFDANEARLVATAKRLGVRVIRVERRGTPKMHIDLCSGPLRKALAEAEGG